VPMLLYGDESGRSQNGNNNAYCQDNELAWMHWKLSKEQEDLLEFTKMLIRIRRENPVLHRRKFFQGRPIKGSQFQDIYWFKNDGTQMTDADWNTTYARCIGMFLNGREMDTVDEKGVAIKDDIIMIILNSYWGAIDFRIPEVASKRKTNWEVLIDTAKSEQPNDSVELKNSIYQVQARSVVLLRYTIFPELFASLDDF
jgi:isoamylase